MTNRTALVAVALAAFVSGALVTGLTGYLSFERYLNEQYEASFYANAAHAQFEARALSNLRSGAIDKVISNLELKLDSDTIQLAEFESAVPKERRHPLVYDALGEVRAYAAKYPAHFEYALQQAAFEKALALGAKAR